jgi:hypothetical protein
LIAPPELVPDLSGMADGLSAILAELVAEIG